MGGVLLLILVESTILFPRSGEHTNALSC